MKSKQGLPVQAEIFYTHTIFFVLRSAVLAWEAHQRDWQNPTEAL